MRGVYEYPRPNYGEQVGSYRPNRAGMFRVYRCTVGNPHRQGGGVMRKASIIALFLALIVAGGYRATHHPIYKCHTDKVGETVCKLIRYEGNK